MSNINNIICVCETCISAMLLQSDINKWRLSKLYKLDKFYIIYALTRLLQISKIDLIGYKNQIFPNNLHIHLRVCDVAPSYHCPSQITGSKIKKRDCILNCFDDFPRIDSPYLES